MKTLLPLFSIIGLAALCASSNAELPDGFAYNYGDLTFNGAKVFDASNGLGGHREEIVLAEADFDGNGQTDYIFQYDPFVGRYDFVLDRDLNSQDGWTLLFLIDGETATLGWRTSVIPEDFAIRLRALYDADGDGLPNAILNFGAKVLSVSNAPHDFEVESFLDSDGDGLSDLAEVDTQTSYFHADTDGDTLPDGWEVAHGRDPLTPDLEYFAELHAQAFPAGEPSIEIARDRSVTVTGLYPVDGVEITVQVSEDLETWRDGGTAEDAVSGVLEFTSPLPGGFVRLSVSEE